MLAILSFLYLSYLVQYARTQTFGQAQLVYEWKWLDYVWPSDADKQNASRNGTFIKERNLVSGIEVYNGQVYLSIPRRSNTGIPVTLAKVVFVDGKSKLEPYPNWAAQKQGDCDALQFAQGIESDPNTGLLYVVDTGRAGNTANSCPAKIVVYDLKTNTQVGLHKLPDDVVDRNNFLNDIVLDYVGGKVRYAYITDTNNRTIVVYDFQERTAHKLRDPSMEVESERDADITINGTTYNFPLAVNGIAMSPDFQFVYYCVLGGYSLFQVPTSTLRNPLHSGSPNIKTVGKKVSQTDGMVFGKERLFYGAVGLNAVYYWNAIADIAAGNGSMVTQKLLFRNDSQMIWPNSLVFDGEGWLWIVCTSLPYFHKRETPVEAANYMRVWKVFVNEKGYLDNNSGQTLVFSSYLTVFSVLAFAFVANRVSV